MLQTTLFLAALTGLATADQTSIGRSRHRGPPSNLLPFAGTSNNRINLGLQDSCFSFQIECDTNWCIPIGGECCGDGDGAYCEAGYYCTSEGCCMNGETCSGPPSGCLDGKELCDGYCIPEGGDCCGDGFYCDPGATCQSNGTCSEGSDEDVPSDDDDSSSSECDSDLKECDGYCIPLTGVCCGDGLYCDLGETCTGDGFCRDGLSTDPDEDEDEEEEEEEETSTSRPDPTTADDDEATTTEETTTTTEEEETSTTEETTSTTTTTTEEETSTTDDLSAAGETGPVSGGDETTDEGGSGEGAASLVAPSLLMGLIGLLGFAL